MTRIIAITGGSGAGKTTIAQALARRLGPGAVVIAEDDYYRCASAIPDFDPATYNFDAPAAKEHNLLVEHLQAARSGGAFNKPLYDLTTHRRRVETERIAHAETLIVEGIHLFVAADLRALFDTKVFVHADESLRLSRRMLRDIDERNRAPREIVMQFFTNVRPMHETYVEPQRAHADIVLECVFGAGPAEADANVARVAALLEAH
ncbi:MAG: AAA family ATPase [Proteobacteria bacterium]|nr:AAA family ATPase [Pseudomonadota bacterium]